MKDVGNNQQLFGPYPYGHALTDVFLDSDKGTINFEYFREYFEEVALPMEIAKASLGDSYSQYQGPVAAGFVKFLRLSTLRKHSRFPAFQVVRDELVDHTEIEGFTLSGPLSMWGGKQDIFAKSPCVFVSHRWQSPDEPDPDGAHLHELCERLNGDSSSAHPPSDQEVYLWIDYSCLPQRQGRKSLPSEDHACLQAGLANLTEIVKSCDLMILHSPDYMERVWCYTELFVWLSKLSEVINIVHGKRPFDSILTQRASRAQIANVIERNDVLPLHNSINANLVFRGYSGETDELLEVFKQIFDYVHGAIDSAGYTMGGFNAEYLPLLVSFMCNSWHFLQQKKCAIPEDLALCLGVIVKALKFTNR